MNRKEQSIIVKQMKQYLKEGAIKEELKTDFLKQGYTKREWQKIAKKLPTKNLFFGILRGIWAFIKIVLCFLLIIVIITTILVLIFGQDISLEDIDDATLRDMGDAKIIDIPDDQNGHLIMSNHGEIFPDDKNKYTCYECSDKNCTNTIQQEFSCYMRGQYLNTKDQLLPENITSIKNVFEKHPEELKAVHNIMEARYFVAKHLYTIPKNFFEASLEASQNDTKSWICWDCVRVNNLELTTILADNQSPLKNRQRFINYINAVTTRVNLDNITMFSALALMDDYAYDSLPKYQHFQSQINKKEQTTLIEDYLELSNTLPKSFERGLKLNYQEDLHAFEKIKDLHNQITYLAPWGNIIKISDKPYTNLQQRSDIYQSILYDRPMQNKYLEQCINNAQECLLKQDEVTVSSWTELITYLPTWALYHLKHSKQGSHNYDIDYLQSLKNQHYSYLQKSILKLRFHSTNLALQLYYQDNKKLPKSLNELVPEYISEVPQDIFGEGEIRYLPQNKTLCSIGENLVDDGCSIEPLNQLKQEGQDRRVDAKNYLDLPDIPYEIIIWDTIQEEAIPAKTHPSTGIKRRPAPLPRN